VLALEPKYIKTAAMEDIMFARIYQPAKTAMSSGTAKTKLWVLEFAHSEARRIDPLMGWTSSDDTQTQVRLQFDTKDAAVDYAERHGIQATIVEPQKRATNVRPGGYGENFATNRRGVWTH
jgi:NADH dehydrogenase